MVSNEVMGIDSIHIFVKLCPAGLFRAYFNHASWAIHKYQQSMYEWVSSFTLATAGDLVR